MSRKARLGPEFRSIPINREANGTPASVVTSGESQCGGPARAVGPAQDE